MSNHLIIFIKNPVAGKVKTRLANSLGAQKALEIYCHLLDLTREAASKSECTRNLFYSDRIDETDDWKKELYNKFVQEGNDLGDRMKNAFDQIFALGAEKAVVIGSDCPDVTSELIESAFRSLDEKDVVIGPAKDGGYYLLGMKKPLPFLFDDKEWSTETVFEDTAVDLMENRLTYKRLPELSDVDTIYDLQLLKGRFGS